jgi:exosortase/archaeosortase family protein
MNRLKNKIVFAYQQIPNAVRHFLVRAFAIAFSWKLIYLLFFMNPRILDDPLTNHVGISAAYVLNHFSGMHQFEAIKKMDTSIMEGQIQIAQVSTILHRHQKVLHIADGCNGLELMVLYSGFIFCYPATKKRKVQYILFGLLMIDFFNIARCSLLGFIKENYHPYFYISHHFVFKAVVYAVIVILWGYYTRKTVIHENIL